MLVSNGNRGDDFQLWELKVRPALQRKDFILVRTDDNANRKVTEKAMSMIIATPGDNPLRSVQDCIDTETAWDRLEARNSGSTLMNGLGVLNSLLNTKNINKLHMRHHVLQLESQFSRFAEMGSFIEQSIKIIILLSLMTDRQEYHRPLYRYM